MRVVALKESDRNLHDAERKLRVAVSGLAKAGLYREAIEQYRAATLVSADVSKALRRTLDVCRTCERRCPGLPACERGL